MNILLMTSSYYPHRGGVETVVNDLAHGLVVSGDNVIVVTNYWPTSLPFIEYVDKIIVIRVPMVLPFGRFRMLTSLKSVISHIVLSVMMLVFRPSIINIHCVGPNGYWGKRLSDIFKVPLVVSTHGERTNDSSGFYLVKQNIDTYDELIATAKSVVCVSDVSATESLTNCVGNSNKVVIIPNAITVDEQVPRTADRDIDIVYVGRLVPEKGVDILIKAISNLIHFFPGVRVKIVGDGPDCTELNRLVMELGLASHVTFLGQMERIDIVQLLKRCKILVLPSRKESFGLVLLEAANAGCAVVATSTGGIPSIINHNTNGLLFEIDSVEQLGLHLVNLLHNEDFRLKLVEEFTSRLPQYDISNFVTRYRNVFADVAK